MLLGSTAAVVGCGGPENDPSSESEKSSQTASQIPLRVLIVNDVVDPESILLGWQSIDSGDLEMTQFGLDATDANPIPGGGDFDADLAADLDADLAAAVGDCDVVIAPSIVTADLINAGVIDPPRGRVAEETSRVWLPAIRAALVRYGDKDVAFAIGAATPLVVSNSDLPPLKTWDQWDQFASGPDQRFAMPTAPGQAAWTLLNRLPAIGPSGLFDRDNFDATIASQPNVDAMQKLVTLAKSFARSPEDGWTAQAIWSSVLSQELTTGLAIAPTSTSENDDLNIAAAPIDGNRQLVNPMSPVAMISTRCRQSRLANQFAHFLSGASSGTEARQQIASATPVRITERGTNDYQQTLIEQFTSPLIAPTLRILGGWRYYAVLDRAVIGCLGGEMSAADAMQTVASRWDELSDHFGRENQVRAMHRNQGFRA